MALCNGVHVLYPSFVAGIAVSVIMHQLLNHVLSYLPCL